MCSLGVLVLSVVLLSCVVGAQHERLMDGLTPREQAVMESVIESIDMKSRVDEQVQDLKKQIQQGWRDDEDDSVSPAWATEPRWVELNMLPLRPRPTLRPCRWLSFRWSWMGQ